MPTRTATAVTLNSTLNFATPGAAFAAAAAGADFGGAVDGAATGAAAAVLIVATVEADPPGRRTRSACLEQKCSWRPFAVVNVRGSGHSVHTDAWLNGQLSPRRHSSVDACAWHVSSFLGQLLPRSRRRTRPAVVAAWCVASRRRLRRAQRGRNIEPVLLHWHRAPLVRRGTAARMRTGGRWSWRRCVGCCRRRRRGAGSRVGAYTR